MSKFETKDYNVKAHVSWRKKNSKHDGDSFMNCFAGSVGKEVAKTKIKTKLKCRPHKFSDGMGQVADKLIIEIDFAKATVQPHSRFEDDFGVAVAEAIADNVNGLFENAD